MKKKGKGAITAPEEMKDKDTNNILKNKILFHSHNPKRISEVVADITTNLSNPLGKILRKCTCIKELLKQQECVSFYNLTDNHE